MSSYCRLVGDKGICSYIHGLYGDYTPFFPTNHQYVSPIFEHRHKMTYAGGCIQISHVLADTKRFRVSSLGFSAVQNSIDAKSYHTKLVFLLVIIVVVVVLMHCIIARSGIWGAVEFIGPLWVR